MNTPLISVVMATFNDDATFLKIAIDSIIRQTLTDWEFIIVDDSTEQSTIDCLCNYASQDNRIRLIRNEQQLGFVASLNKGVSLAQGQYIARMDGDDISYPDRFQKQVAFLQQNNQYDVVGSVINIIDGNGKVTSQIHFREKDIPLRLFTAFRCPMQHGSVIMRRKICDENVPLYDEQFQKAEDLELWLRLMKNGYKLYNIQEPLFCFRVLGNYAEKRNYRHFAFNLRARLKNFTWRYPFTGTVGIFMSVIYRFVPHFIKKRVYKHLNEKL